MDEYHYPELGTRFWDIWIERKNFSGYMEAIETVVEFVANLEDKEETYRVGVHWLADHEHLRVRVETKFPANEALARYFAKHREMDIPQEVWRMMESEAFKFLNIEEVRDVLVTERAVEITRDKENRSRIILTFKSKKWSGYTLIYHETEDKKLKLLETRNCRCLPGERAKHGHSRVPKVLCEAAHCLVSRYVENLPSQHSLQQELQLEVSDASG